MKTIELKRLILSEVFISNNVEQSRQIARKIVLSSDIIGSFLRKLNFFDKNDFNRIYNTFYIYSNSSFEFYATNEFNESNRLFAINLDEQDVEITVLRYS